MSDSEDSNFSEEEDSERSSDGEEAEVCAPGDRDRPRRRAPMEAPGSRQPVGRERERSQQVGVRQTGSGGRPGGLGCGRYWEIRRTCVQAPGNVCSKHSL